MAISGISIANLLSSTPYASQSITQKQGGHHARSISNMETMGSSATATAASSASPVGSKIDLKV
jgi:hypothetical protein